MQSSSVQEETVRSHQTAPGAIRIFGRLTPLLVAALLLPGCGEAERPSAPERYSTRLAPLNDSGVEGRAIFTLSSDRLIVDIEATGLEPKRIHAQNLFAATSGKRPTRCPTAEADRDGDDLVAFEEGERSYGPIARALEPYPTVGADGDLDYVMGSRVDPSRVLPLDGRVLLLQGMQVSASGGAGAELYDPGVPVACGRLARMPVAPPPPEE